MIYANWFREENGMSKYSVSREINHENQIWLFRMGESVVGRLKENQELLSVRGEVFSCTLCNNLERRHFIGGVDEWKDITLVQKC